MNNGIINPFLKWAGGKRQLIGQIQERMPSKYNKFIEPFVGGGSVFLYFQPNRGVICDTNRQLINCYEQIKKSPQEIASLLKEIESIPSNKEYYLSLRKKFNEKIASHIHDPESAALMIWLNKHCFNGLYRVNSKGLFNVPYNNDSSSLYVDEKNLIYVGVYLENSDIEILCDDYSAACKKANPGDFVYLDPPYLPMSNTANFTSYSKNGFDEKEHIKLAKIFHEMDDRGVKIMLSNNDTQKIYKLYEGYNITPVEVGRFVNCKGSKRKSREVLITNY